MDDLPVLFRRSGEDGTGACPPGSLLTAYFPAVRADEVLARLPSLPRPVVLLESGAGRPGTVRLAWGARKRIRMEWDELSAGDSLLLSDHCAGLPAFLTSRKLL